MGTVLNMSNPPSGVSSIGGGDGSNLLAEIKNKITPQGIAWLRQYMGDTPEFNDLREGVNELKDEDLAMSLLSGADFINSIPPLLQIAVAGPRSPNTHLLPVSSFIAMEMMVHRRLRMELASSDSTVSTDRQKADKWLALLEKQRVFYHELIRRYKIAINAGRSGTFLPSGYFFDPFVA